MLNRILNSFQNIDIYCSQFCMKEVIFGITNCISNMSL